MSATNEKSDTQKLTFRRYKDGDSKHVPWNKQIFQASHTYKCPTYIQSTPPCQGSCPLRRGHPRLPEHRARRREAAGRRRRQAGDAGV